MAAIQRFTLPAIRRARDLIDLRYDEPLSLDDLAREAGWRVLRIGRRCRGT